MNVKVLLIFSVCAAVIVGGVSVAYVSAQREAQARAEAEAETSRADAAAAEARKADREAAAAAEKARAESEKRKQLEAERDKAQIDRDAAADEKVAAAENRKAKEAESARAKADAEAEVARRDAARAKADEAREGRLRAAKVAEAEAAKAQAEAARLAIEKAKADKVMAEAKLQELRRLDLEAFARDLLERERDVTEREQALQPEKTIADLSWAGGDEDSVMDDKGNVTKKVKAVYLPENDRTLPRATRMLAKMERNAREDASAAAARVRDSVVSMVEGLYVAALREDRVVDAEYYRRTLRSMYPDWEFSITATNSTATVAQ